MSDAAPVASGAELNPYRVDMGEEDLGWEVRIVAPSGEVVWARACEAEEEARTLASTVRQHVSWLSAGKFREYYRLAEAG